jgi:glycerate-2-kinase
MARCVRLRETMVQVARIAVGRVSGVTLVARAGLAPGRMRVWATGKAARAMLDGARAALGSDATGGVVIEKARDARDSASVDGPWRFFAAAHPFPDERGVAATHALMDDARALGAGDRALLLLSGGTSALLAAPAPPATLAIVDAATRALLLGGASIGELNTVRRHLGAALGGRLALATDASIDVLALSDVVGDDPAAIGSGPVSPDPSTVDDARAIARRYQLPPDVDAALAACGETPKPSHAAFRRVSYRILATPLSLRAEAAAIARARFFKPIERPELVTGPLEDFAAELVDRAASLAHREVLIAVGEPTVRVIGDGRGGRAQHLALTMARAIHERLDGRARRFVFVACGSDGSDGPTDAAGAGVDWRTWPEAMQRKLDPERALARFDSHTPLAALGHTIVTGPTGTNLTDLFLLARGA